MKSFIGTEAIKIKFIQTLPGAEIEVALRMNDFCKKREDIIEFAILKAFGGYDVVIIYKTNNFGLNLGKYGPVPGILKANTFLCFPYQWNNDEPNFSTIINDINESTFSSLIFLKMRSDAESQIYEVEQDFFKYICKKDLQNGHFFGTIGWNELVFLFSKNDIDDILNNIFELNYSSWLDSKKARLLIKTFSYVCLNYRKMFGGAWGSDEGLKIDAIYFNNLMSALMENDCLKSKIDLNTVPTLHISSKPDSYIPIKKYWQNKGFITLDLIGENDILAMPKDGYIGTWGDFISANITFRRIFYANIHSTHTEISFKGKDDSNNDDSIFDLNVDQITLDDLIPYDDISEIFKENTSILATQFNALYSLSQNPITGLAFKDMQLYPHSILFFGNQNREHKNRTDKLAISAAECLSIGNEIRSYGLYGHVEKKYARFAKIKGGIQRSLLALEFFPKHILDRLLPPKMPWFGFVNAWEKQFFRANEVIFVPFDSLWDPTSWWALYHEIAHILIDREPLLVSDNDPIIQSFLSDKQDSEPWLKYIQEIVAEIIGYELGFCGQYELFIESVWSYLGKTIVNDEENCPPPELYAMRTFFVSLWHENYGHESSKLEISDEKFSEDYIFGKFLEHMDEIKPYCNLNFTRKYFVIAGNIKIVKQLWPFINNLYHQLISLEKKKNIVIRSIPDWLKDKKSIEIVDKLFLGEIHWHDIKYPEAVLCHILKNKNMIAAKDKFRFEIASIITFWNAQIKNLNRAPHARDIFRKRKIS
jgi:hypothetical protein